MSPPHDSEPLHAAQAHLQWPPERFYWAVLDASGLQGSRGNLYSQLGYLFENLIPGVPIEQVHAIYQRVASAPPTYLACGIQREVLTSDVPGHALTLCPSQVPEFVREQLSEVGDQPPINLLSGPFAPKPVQRLRNRCAGEVMAVLALGGLLLVIGFERRVNAHERGLAQADQQRLEIVDAILPRSGSQSPRWGGQPGGQPAELRMVAELRQLERTRTAAGPATEDENCAAVLAEFLAHWPPELFAQVETITVTPTSITVRGKVPAMGDAQLLADALNGLSEWTVAQPQSEVRQGHVDVTLRLDHRPPSSPPSSRAPTNRAAS